MIPKPHRNLFSLSRKFQVCILKGVERARVMHTLKGGWVGQTCALAKSNESGGRKARVRLSKQERKELVESYIKKYQSLNNGNFPSLRLAHKEVGGSFYTIREIVREIIQENRVLGPGKSLPEKQNANQLLEKFRLGTISTEPEASPNLSSNGSPLPYDQHQNTNEELYAYDQHQNASEELYLISDKHYAEPEKQGFDDKQIIDGGHVIVISKECDGEDAEAQVTEVTKMKKSMEEVAVSRTEVTQMANVIVETFPLRQVTEQTDILDGNVNELRDSNGTLAEKDIEKMPLEPGYGTSKPDGMNLSNNSCLMEDKEEESLSGQPLEGTYSLMDEKAVKNVADLPSGGISNSFANVDIVHDGQVDIDVEVKSSYHDKAIAETEIANPPNGVQTKTLNGTNANTNSNKPIVHEVTGNKANGQHSRSSEKPNTPTLDRIDLKSWEGAKKRAESETNPLLATFKSFVAAIKKFLSE